MFGDWLKISTKLAYYDYDMKEFLCPECSSKRVKYAYVGNATSRIGYLSVWCEHCNKGIRISRVKIPIDVEMIEFGDWEKLENVIPNFENIIIDQ